MLLGEKFKKKTCLELYEVQDGDSMPKDVITLRSRKDLNESKQIRMNEFVVKVF